MILAEKITELRKKNGWSQEALANHLGVSRQAISKWESAQSTPDLDRILAMSEVFGVSTDLLMKDELELAPVIGYAFGDDDGGPSADTRSAAEIETEALVHRVSMEEANAYLRTVRETVRPFGLGVSLCVVSLVPLLILANLSEDPAFGISESVASAIGVGALFLLAAFGVTLIILTSSRLGKWSWLEKDLIETAYGVTGMVKQHREDFRPRLITQIATGVALCIMAIVPLVVLETLAEDTASTLVSEGFASAVGLGIMFSLAAVAVYLFVTAAVPWGAFHKLLEEGDYSRKRKRVSVDPFLEAFAGVYWLLILAAFLVYGFVTADWERSWIIWPIAGVLFAALMVGLSYRVEVRRGRRQDARRESAQETHSTGGDSAMGDHAGTVSR